MAFDADLYLRRFAERGMVGQRLYKTGSGQGRGALLVDLVTGNAGQSSGFMSAAFPKQPGTSLVALEALRVLLAHGKPGVLTEAKDEFARGRPLIRNTRRARPIVLAGRFHVFPSGPVAGFAAFRLQLILRRTKEDSRHFGGGKPAIALPVAFFAGITAHVAGLVRGLRPDRKQPACQSQQEQRFRQIFHYVSSPAG
jgi:hypothetical protein